MSGPPHILLINPTITKRRNAKFPFAVLNLAAALDARYASSIIDGNVDRDFVSTTVRKLESGHIDAVGVSVMGCATVASCDTRVTGHTSAVPIDPDHLGAVIFRPSAPLPSLNVPYVDYAIRGSRGEQTLIELLDVLFGTAGGALDTCCRTVVALEWTDRPQLQSGILDSGGSRAACPTNGWAIHATTSEERFWASAPAVIRPPWAAASVATFCGVAAMFRGKTALAAGPAAGGRSCGCSTRSLAWTPFSSTTITSSTARGGYGSSTRGTRRAGAALVVFRPRRCPVESIAAVVGARQEEQASNGVHWRRITERLAVARCAQRHSHRSDPWRLSRSAVPTASSPNCLSCWPAAGPGRGKQSGRSSSSGTSSACIRRRKSCCISTRRCRRRPEVKTHRSSGRSAAYATVMESRSYFRPRRTTGRSRSGVTYWCHTDTPWLTPQLRERIRDFTTVLGCRFPTITDVRSPSWGKAGLQALASWRYRYQRYGRPWEARPVEEIRPAVGSRVSRACEHRVGSG